MNTYQILFILITLSLAQLPVIYLIKHPLEANLISGIGFVVSIIDIIIILTVIVTSVIYAYKFLGTLGN